MPGRYSHFDLSNRFGLGARLAPDNDISRLFANCYLVCRDNFQEIEGMAGPGYKDVLAGPLCKAGQIVERSLGGLLIDDAGLKAIHEFLQEKQPLLHAAAMLGAIAARLKISRLAAFGETIFEASNGERFHVAPVPLRSIWAMRGEHYAMATPHAESSIAAFHPGVQVTPVLVKTKEGWVTLHRRPLPSVLRSRTALGRIKIALCPMTGDAPKLRVTAPGTPNEKTRFLVDAPRNEPDQVAFLRSILDRCQAESVTILVLPELRVSPGIRAALVDWLAGFEGVLSLAFVVAGSWHVESGGHWVNRCDTIGPRRGEVLWTNDKLADYEISRGVVAKSPKLRGAGIDKAGGREDIRRSNRLTIVDTPIGRMTTAICKGFFSEGAEAVMKESGADLFFVPAMSPKTRDMVLLAEQLTRYRAGTFMANCASTGPDERSFWRVPIDARALKNQKAAREAFQTCAAEAGQELLIWECPYEWEPDALDIL